jgi:hypothetical protein
MNLRLLLFIFLLCLTNTLFSQDNGPQKKIDLRDYQYKHEASGGFRIQSNGISAFAEYGWIKDIFRTKLIQVEYMYYIDYEQKKQTAQVSNERDYVYGLQNHFHVIRFSYGGKRTVVDKADYHGARLSVVGFGGVNLGLLKPYYLDLYKYVPQYGGYETIVHERYNSSDGTSFLSNDSIAGAAPIRYGLGQMQPVLGVHGKLALDFDWGSRDAVVKAIEAGVMLDIYYKVLPIMINDENHFYQLGVFLSIQFGKRW